MKKLDCNQINIFINLKIIVEEDKNKKKKIYIYFIFKSTQILQFGEDHLTQLQLLRSNFII